MGSQTQNCMKSKLQSQLSSFRAKKMSAESQITALGISLPDAPKPGGVYAPALIVGDMIHVSGHVPWLEGGGFIQGKVGLEVGPEVGVEAARRTGLYVLATLKKYLGSLDRVERIVKTFGMVNTNPETIKGSECITIINGFSNLMMEVFGPEKGVGARSAVGLATLPHNCPVEVE